MTINNKKTTTMAAKTKSANPLSITLDARKHLIHVLGSRLQ
jgi:hypothetical protein